jgi:hypothetical protein
MAHASRFFERLDQPLQRRGVCYAAVLDRIPDAGQVLRHHPARADVEVSNLGVAHLPLRQADVPSGGAQKGMRARAPEFIEGGRARLPDGVVDWVLPPTPSVEDHEHHGTVFLHRGAPFEETEPGMLEVLC